MGGESEGGDGLVNRFVIYIESKGNPASLILDKVYRTLPDASAESHNMIRVIDEDKSEPDGYLYPASMFAPIDLPEVAMQARMVEGLCKEADYAGAA
jgi:hypothetical protein